jgi:glycosyltransferase involved in cell wall biosynthesis
VFAQSTIPSEIILVEDCSGDETLAALHELNRTYNGRLRIIQMPTNQGAASARNAGWSMAEQPFIAFLDADDSWHPEKIRIQYEVMSQNPEIALCGHQCHYASEEKNGMTALLAVPKISNISTLSLLMKNPFSTPTVMLRREIRQRFQDGKRCAEDFLLWQQIAFAGLRVVRLESPLAYVHKPIYGSSGLSAQLWEMEKGELSNFSLLYDTGRIGIILYAMSVCLSLAKYLKRVCMTTIPRLVHRP